MTTKQSIVSSSLLWREPGKAPCDSHARIAFADGLITDVAVGGPAIRDGRLLMPALVNAHDHVRGLRHLAFGARDERFETWRAALYAHPRIDVYSNACLALGRMALAGIGTTLCVYSSIRVDRLIDDARAIARAAKDVGIRVGFVVPFRNRCTMALGDDQAVLALQSPEDRALIEKTWLYPWPSAETYIEIAREIGKLESDTFFVQYGPNSPHACSDELMEAIIAAAAADNRRIHMHFLESEPQRQWADAAFPNGILKHYDAMGLFSERFTGAHGIWLSQAECDFLASRGASIAVNTSSNLHLYSGLSPIDRYLRAGLKFAFGLDSFSLDDDEDMLRELRLSFYLHSVAHRPPGLTPASLFDAALKTGFWIVTNKHGYGAIEPGMPMDVLSLDYAAMTRDLIEGMIEPEDAMIARASSRYVRDLWVAGRQIVSDGKLVTIDLAAAEQDVLAQARAAGEQMRALKPAMARHQKTLRDFYDRGLHMSPQSRS
ncbi:amidohydrolase family protein [Bradyrhizobium sp. NP1]|uniref:amidohydrolase family protein n=1 Tax=Bradyrhizobium sp. NP1 TaxID=3049772 RepID=UPI0025A551D3|nr:amidohydrolase family protein [Bradyrhizobium sp. NP1]WJR80855.1 amidohydrolase family protein [Bradyrhizobium sp. NP1]